MNLDFHYYMIRVLAEKAGFTPSESQIVAYASQFVDDAVGYVSIKIDTLPSRNFGDLIRPDGLFDSICTAHKSTLMYISGVRPKAQFKTYIPFHFIPTVPYNGNGAYDYRTVPNNELANKIVRTAINELGDADGDMRTQKLIKLGVALHSFADTWAHQQFSGRYSYEDNSVENIQIYNGKEWYPGKLQESVMKLAMETGHVKAGYYPDYSHITWKYINGASRKEIERNNVLIFLEAARTIFDSLCEAAGNTVKWDEHESKIKDCLSFQSENLEEKCKKYEAIFPEIKFKYDEMEWRHQALTGEWDRFLAVGNITDLIVPPQFHFQGDLKWFDFHIAAAEQRKYVTKNIKPLPPVLDASQVNRILANIGEMINIFETPKELKEKFRWLTVSVRNETQFRVKWTEQSYFGSGRFWDAPSDVDLFKSMIFSSCNREKEPTGVSGATKFSIILDKENEIPFVIAFSNPLVGSMKCWATFNDDCETVWDKLDSGSKKDYKESGFKGEKLILELVSVPGQEAVVSLKQSVVE